MQLFEPLPKRIVCDGRFPFFVAFLLDRSINSTSNVAIIYGAFLSRIDDKIRREGRPVIVHGLCTELSSRRVDDVESLANR